VFFALYKVLFITIEMRHAPFYGWIKDLSAPDPTTIFNLFGLIPWDPSHLQRRCSPLIQVPTMLIQVPTMCIGGALNSLSRHSPRNGTIETSPHPSLSCAVSTAGRSFRPARSLGGRC
jgi:membrane protein insertase Oxa1/YidC/SpoIIIJ